MAKYGRQLWKMPMLASKLTGEFLHKNVRAMSPSSTGRDG